MGKGGQGGCYAVPRCEGLTVKASQCWGRRYRVDPNFSDCWFPKNVVWYRPGENIYAVKHPKGHPQRRERCPASLMGYRRRCRNFQMPFSATAVCSQNISFGKQHSWVWRGEVPHKVPYLTGTEAISATYLLR